MIQGCIQLKLGVLRNEGHTSRIHIQCRWLHLVTVLDRLGHLATLKRIIIIILSIGFALHPFSSFLHRGHFQVLFEDVDHVDYLLSQILVFVIQQFNLSLGNNITLLLLEFIGCSPCSVNALSEATRSFDSDSLELWLFSCYDWLILKRHESLPLVFLRLKKRSVRLLNFFDNGVQESLIFHSMDRVAHNYCSSFSLRTQRKLVLFLDIYWLGFGEAIVLVVGIGLQIFTDILLSVDHTPSFRHQSQILRVDDVSLRLCQCLESHCANI